MAPGCIFDILKRFCGDFIPTARGCLFIVGEDREGLRDRSIFRGGAHPRDALAQ